MILELDDPTRLRMEKSQKNAEAAHSELVREPQERTSDMPASGSTNAEWALIDLLLEEYFKLHCLSGQQKRVLRLHLGGFRDREIALKLGCSLATVREHWRRIIEKTGGKHRVGVVARALEFLRSHPRLRALLSD